MTDERLDQILKNALAPEVTEEEIKVTGRKGTNKMARIFKRVSTGVAAAIGILAVGTGTIAMVNPALAAKLPLIGNIFSQTQDNVTFSGDYSEKSTVISEEQTVMAEDGGFTITASEVYCDGNSVYLTLMIESEEADFSYMPKHITGDDENNQTTASSMYLNYYCQAGDDEKTSTRMFGTAEGVVADANTFAGILKIDMSEPASDLDMINVQITKIGYDDVRPDYQNNTTESATYSYTGVWNLSIPAAVDADGAREFTFDESAGNVTLKTVAVSPYEVIVDAEQVGNGEVMQGFVVVYDKDGEKLQYANGNGKPTYSYFAVQGKDISLLQVYVFDNDEDWFDVYKCGTIDNAKERAVISKIINIE